MADEQKKSRVEILENAVETLTGDVKSLKTGLEGLMKDFEDAKAAGFGTKAKGLFGGKREKRPVVDTTTNVVYLSQAAAGKALAGEADTAPDDHFAWYKLVSKFPTRFRDASTEEADKAQAEQAAREAEALAKAEAEEAARAKAEGAKAEQK